MKDKIKYISLIAVFVILVFSITITNLLLKYDESGSFESNKEYLILSLIILRLIMK